MRAAWSIRKRPPPPCWLRRVPLGLGFSPGPRGSPRSQQVCVALTQREPPPRRSLTAGTCHHSQPTRPLRGSPAHSTDRHLQGTIVPFGTPGTGDQPAAGSCHLPATVGEHRVSHPLDALTATRAYRACFIPDAPMGFRPPGPFPFTEPRRLSAPVSFLTFTSDLPRPADHRTARRRALCGPGHPNLAVREAKRLRGADPTATCRASETRSGPTTRCRVDPAVLPWRSMAS